MSKIKAKQFSELYSVPPGDCLDMKCPICEQLARPDNSDYACRVCGKVYHRRCCEESGRYDGFDLSVMDRAFDKTGWSCYDCDNSSLIDILTDDDNMEISNIFAEYDVNGDDSITLEEYLGACQHIMGRELTSRERHDETEQFKLMDRDGSGDIGLDEFLASEAPHFIRKYDKEYLVAKLTPLEKKRAREIFNRLDRDKDGSIDYWEAMLRSGIEGWMHLSKRLKDILDLRGGGGGGGAAQDDVTARPQAHKKTSKVGQHLFPGALNVRKCDENNDGKVEWDEFLRGHALKIILSRPNKSDAAVANTR